MVQTKEKRKGIRKENCFSYFIIEANFVFIINGIVDDKIEMNDNLLRMKKCQYLSGRFSLLSLQYYT